MNDKQWTDNNGYVSLEIEVFKCRGCGNKYDHETMASENDVSLCKWCSGEWK
jgi:NAD-dependent SIR2 family protein deacetylase